MMATADPQIRQDLRRLAERMMPRWWFFLLEAVLLSAWTVGIAADVRGASLLAGITPIVLIFMPSLVYRRLNGVRSGGKLSDAGARYFWLAAGLAVPFVGGAILASRWAEQGASAVALGGFVVVLAAVNWVLLQQLQRTETGAIRQGTTVERLAVEEPPEPQAIYDDRDALRICLLLGCVESIRRGVLREALDMDTARLEAALHDLQQRALVSEGQDEPHVDDGRSDWLHHTFQGELAIRRHLAALRESRADVG